MYRTLLAQLINRKDCGNLINMAQKLLLMGLNLHRIFL